MANSLGIGGDDYYQQLGFGAMQQVANLQNQRNLANKQLQAQSQSNALSGIASGAATGFAVGGPWGAAIGAGVGLLGSHFLG